ncbi:type II secretion system protein GspN [bacterium]|nr:type II secretion system protein GspN [candidate division CSSED10-310 bacterium]
MKSIKRTLFRWTLYWIILPVILFYAVVWIFKPHERLMNRLKDDLHRQAGIELMYERVRISFLGAIRLDGLVVSQTRELRIRVEDEPVALKPRRYAAFDSLTLQIAMKPLFEGKAAIKMTGSAYGGQFTGVLSAPIQTEPAPFTIDGAWDQIDLSLLAGDHPGLQVQSGHCSGSTVLQVDQARVYPYQGPVEFSIDEAGIAAPETFSDEMDIPVINRITGRFDMNEQEIRIHEVWGYGPDTTFQVSGSVHQRIPVRNSWLDLTVKMYLTGDGQPVKVDEYLPITITGPAKDPQIEFLGRNLRK